MTSEESRFEILKRVEDGTLTAEEGSDLIGILDRGREAAPEVEVFDPIPPVNHVDNAESPQVSGWWKALWSLILIGGAVLTGFSALSAYRGYERAGLGWGFWLSWLPFILGVLLMVFGWILLDSPWMHLKVFTRESGKTQKINIAIPVPLKLISWGIRTFGRYIPADLKEKGLEEMLSEVEAALKRGEPFQIEVDDKEDGDQVYITIAR
jgi:hypothetical protein